MDVVAATANEEAGSESPSSKCPICLSQIENPAYTDKCFHQFCFSCLLEWSKVNAVCPLCKQGFKTIVYDVQSYEKFKEMPVKVEETLLPVAGFSISGVINHRSRHSNRSLFDDARFRYRTTMSWPFRQMMRRLEEQRLTELLRSPSVRISSGREFVFTDETRKAIYRTGLRVQHLETRAEQVFSCISPRFFRENPACKIRLAQWLQRELRVLLHFNNRYDVDSASCIIMNLLDVSRLGSPNFCNQLQPYFGYHTYHFLQELYCFARSAPYTMSGYDSLVVYGEGTSGTIWSEWYCAETRTESDMPFDVENAADSSRLPSDRLPLSFQIFRRTPDQPSTSTFSAALSASNVRQNNSPVPTVSRLSSQLSFNVVNLSDEEEVCDDRFMVLSNESDEDIEVVGHDPPWHSRSPIIISDDDSRHELRCKERNTRSEVEELIETGSRHDEHAQGNRSSEEFRSRTSKGRDNSADQHHQRHSSHRQHRKHKRHLKNHSCECNKGRGRSSSQECDNCSRQRSSRSRPHVFLPEERPLEKFGSDRKHRSDLPNSKNPSPSHREYSPSTRHDRKHCAEGLDRRGRSSACEFLKRNESRCGDHPNCSRKHKRRHKRHRRSHDRNSSEVDFAFDQRPSKKHKKMRKKEASRKRSSHEQHISCDLNRRNIEDYKEQGMTCKDCESKEHGIQIPSNCLNLADTSSGSAGQINVDLGKGIEEQQSCNEFRGKNSVQFWSDSDSSDELLSKGLRSAIGYSSYSGGAAAAAAMASDSFSDGSRHQKLYSEIDNDDDKRKTAVDKSEDRPDRRRNTGDGKVCATVNILGNESCDDYIKSSSNKGNVSAMRSQGEAFVEMKAGEAGNIRKDEGSSFNRDSPCEIVNAIFCDAVYVSGGTTFKKHSTGHKSSLFKFKNAEKICQTIENYTERS